MPFRHGARRVTGDRGGLCKETRATVATLDARVLTGPHYHGTVQRVLETVCLCSVGAVIYSCYDRRQRAPFSSPPRLDRLHIASWAAALSSHGGILPNPTDTRWETLHTLRPKRAARAGVMSELQRAFSGAGRGASRVAAQVYRFSPPHSSRRKGKGNGAHRSPSPGEKGRKGRPNMFSDYVGRPVYVPWACPVEMTT